MQPVGVDPATYEVSVQPDPSLPVPMTPWARCRLQAHGLAGWVFGIIRHSGAIGSGVHILVKCVFRTTEVF